MNCNEVSELLLEEDIALLAGGGNSPMAEHLRTCASCAAMAAALHRQHLVMVRDYRELRPRLSANEAAAATTTMGAALNGLAPASSARPASPHAVHVATSMRTLGRGRGIVASAFLGAAMAAALVVALVHQDSGEGTAAGNSRVMPERTPIEVEVPPNQNAIVFETRNPNITVVWLYSGD